MAKQLLDGGKDKVGTLIKGSLDELVPAATSFTGSLQVAGDWLGCLGQGASSSGGAPGVGPPVVYPGSSFTAGSTSVSPWRVLAKEEALRQHYLVRYSSNG